MMIASTPTFAQATTRTYYEWMRLQSLDRWWHWMVLVIICLSLLGFVTMLYRRDTRELPRGTRWTLILLRTLALVGLLLFFLDLQKRSEHQDTTNSRVALLVDTSQSMALPAEVPDADPQRDSRIESVVGELKQGTLLNSLREKHDVHVYRFDQQNTPLEVAYFPKRTAAADPGVAVAEDQRKAVASSASARIVWIIAASFLTVSFIALLAHFILGALVRGAEGESWAMLVTIVALIFAVVIAAVADLRYPNISPLVALGLRDMEEKTDDGAKDKIAEEADNTAVVEPKDVDWAVRLATGGTETRLGEAVRWLAQQERGGPIAAIIVVSDGRNNAGIEESVASQVAKEASIPVHSIGLGSDKQPQSVRMVDLEAPPRVYPGDQFTLKGYVQAYGYSGRTASLSLSSREDGVENAPEVPEETRRVELTDDGEVQPFEFTVTPDAEGKRLFTLHISPPGATAQETAQQRKIRTKTARVQVVNRRNKVLMLAGGPTREYRFLRNLLYRDKSTELHVLLQTAMPGMSQEADEILETFPDDPEEMFEYDCVIAFDPDWRELNAIQADLLERWVAEKAGGLIVIAGPVYTPQWAESRRSPAHIDAIKSLYPVVFYGRGMASMRLGRIGAEQVSQISFSEEGAKASFLWLDDSDEARQRGWGEFDGVYSYYAIKEIKPGAKAYSYLTDSADVRSEPPVYHAGQFYGAGRVFYLGSGEMWRLRAVDDGYFERFYTKLIRYVSEGRLLRDSSRGVLIVSKQRCLLGETIAVRAALSDAQFKPLTVPEVVASLVAPDGRSQELLLRRVQQAAREGMYAGQFTALQDGDYRINLDITSGEAEEMLSQSVRVRVPDREIEMPQRNDALLSTMAGQTGGKYFVGVDAAAGRRGIPPVWNEISAKDLTRFLPGTPDRSFQERLMTWLLALIAGALSLEWLIRRLNKLA